MAPYKIAPGLVLIAHDVLPSLTGPVIVSGALYQLILRLGLRQTLPISRNSALAVILFAGSFVGKAVAKRLWDGIKSWSDKRKLGAIGVPVVRKGNLPGNAGFLWELIRNFPTEYPGEPLVHLKKDYGPIFNLNFLWEDMVRQALWPLYTTSKGTHIKSMTVIRFGQTILHLQRRFWQQTLTTT